MGFRNEIDERIKKERKRLKSLDVVEEFLGNEIIEEQKLKLDQEIYPERYDDFGYVKRFVY